MRKWINPYYEGDREYDHSAGAISVGLVQGAKIAIVLFLLFVAAIAYVVFG